MGPAATIQPGEEVRVVAVGAGEDGAAWRDALRGWTPARGRALKVDGMTGVWSCELLGRACVVKGWMSGGVGDRLKMLLGCSRGWRHWRGASWLMSHGVRTAAPYCMLRGKDSAGGVVEWLIMERVEGPTVLEVLRDIRDGATDLTVKDQHKVAASLGVLASEMVAQGRFNRDNKPSNLILAGWKEGDPVIAVIDCVAIRACRRFDFKAMRRMLASLVIEPLGAGVLPRRSLLMRGLVEIQGQSWWGVIERAVAMHGDPRPRVDPFGSRDAGRVG